MFYPVFHCVLFLDYARWLGQKQNTHHKRMEDGVSHDISENRSLLHTHYSQTLRGKIECVTLDAGFVAHPGYESAV